MKARVKAKQVEILSDSMKQIIEVNKEYHRQILDLKKKLQNKEAELEQVRKSGLVLLGQILELQKENNEFRKTLSDVRTEKTVYEKLVVNMQKEMPVFNDKGELIFKKQIYKKKPNFSWFT